MLSLTSGRSKPYSFNYHVKKFKNQKKNTCRVRSISPFCVSYLRNMTKSETLACKVSKMTDPCTLSLRALALDKIDYDFDQPEIFSFFSPLTPYI